MIRATSKAQRRRSKHAQSQTGDARCGVPRSCLAACSSTGATTAPTRRRPRHRRPHPRAPASAAARCKVGVSWNNYQEERWAKWDEPAIKAALAGRRRDVHLERRQVVGRDPGDQRRQPDLAGRQGRDHPGPGRDGHQAVRREGASPPGIPVIAYDRLIEDPKALYITFDNKLVGKLQAEAVFAVKPTGNYVDHQGQQGRRQRRLPARAAWTRSSRPRSTPATSRSSARPTPTTGIRPRPRPRWSSS